MRRVVALAAQKSRKVLMKMKAAKLGWAEWAGQEKGRSSVGAGQEQGRSRVGAGAGAWEQK